MEKSGKSEHTVKGVWFLRNVQAIYMAGQETGIPVKVIAEAGETYPLGNGQRRPINEGSAYVEIGTGYERDLSEFWKRVEKIKASKH